MLNHYRLFDKCMIRMIDSFAITFLLNYKKPDDAYKTKNSRYTS